MAYIDFISCLHQKTSRDYMSRVEYKAAYSKKSKEFGYDYWDGDRKYGYGGYTYDGRHRPVAESLAQHYNLNASSRVLDVGCGKGYLLYELTQVVPGIDVAGIDISTYAIDNAKNEIKPFLIEGLAQDMPYVSDSFDLIISINTLHNLYIYDLKRAISEIERISRKNSYIVVEAYRNETELVNLFYWQLTCECFFTDKEWEWLFNEFAYTGDHSFIYFE